MLKKECSMSYFFLSQKLRIKYNEVWTFLRKRDNNFCYEKNDIFIGIYNNFTKQRKIKKLSEYIS